PAEPARKVFKCIVDDTALLCGVKKSTRDGIRKWVNNGSLRLFVPLYTLTSLNKLRTRNGRTGRDASDTLRWLDEITSDIAVHSRDGVHIQESMEAYDRWTQVEEYLSPQTLLSMDTEDAEADAATADLEALHLEAGSDASSLGSQDSNELRTPTPSSPRSAYSSTSPGLLNASPYKAAKQMPTPPRERNAHKKNMSSGSAGQGQANNSGIPHSLRPLFNYVVWCIHADPTPDAPVEPFLLLTNDDRKCHIASRFGVRAKRLEQLRDMISREDLEYKNRMTVLKKESESVVISPSIAKHADVGTENAQPRGEDKQSDEDEEDEEVVFKRAPRGPHVEKKIWDPNSFGRNKPTLVGPTPSTPQAPVQAPTHTPTSRGGGRGKRGGFNRGGPYTPKHIAANRMAAKQPAVHDVNQPIDPDSYSRPMNGMSASRGDRRKLWQP
ncbi:hypothetical protein K402DRAFT_309138, partial [Aulographum hederae CBS 113979]